MSLLEIVCGQFTLVVCATTASTEKRLLAELARHTRASHEEMSTQVSVIDEKYADLPTRVSRLETEVFATKQR